MRAAIVAWLAELKMRGGKGRARSVTEFMAKDFLPLLAREEARREQAGETPSADRLRAVAMLLKERFAMLAGKPAKPAAKSR